MLMYSILAFLAIVIQIIVLYQMLKKPKIDKKRAFTYFFYGLSSVGLLMIIDYYFKIDTTTIINFEIGEYIDVFYNVAFFEETSKYISLLILFTLGTKKNYTYKNIIFYSALVAMGFSFIENIFYLYGTDDKMLMLIKRVLVSTPLHMTCGLLIGHGFSIGVNSKKQLIFKLGIFIWYFLCAIFLHGIFNYSIYHTINFQTGTVTIVIIATIGILYTFNLIKNTSKLYD